MLERDIFQCTAQIVLPTEDFWSTYTGPEVLIKGFCKLQRVGGGGAQLARCVRYHNTHSSTSRYGGNIDGRRGRRVTDGARAQLDGRAARRRQPQRVGGGGAQPAQCVRQCAGGRCFHPQKLLATTFDLEKEELEHYMSPLIMTINQ